MADSHSKVLGAYPGVPIVASTANPAPAGSPLTFTVNVQACKLDPFAPFPGVVVCYGFTSTDPTLNGTITLRDGTTVIGTDYYRAPSGFTTMLAPGSHQITAEFSGTPSGIVMPGTSSIYTQVVTGPVSFSGPSATGTGPITAQLSGGGAGCAFASARFLGPPPGPTPLPAVAPAGVVFPHGLFDFTTTTCTPGATITITVIYPMPITQASYWKYGPEPGNVSPHWYTLPATISGDTATFSITDGGVGDDDLVANGVIVDQGGPGLTASAVVPTLSMTALGALALAMLAIAVRARMRQR